MNFEHAIQLIEEQKISHLRVIDTSNKRIFDLNADSTEGLLSQLEPYKQILSSYGRLTFLAANESIFKQNWRDAFTWTVTFGGPGVAGNSSLPAPGVHHSGYISASEAALMTQVESMKQQMDFQKKFDELNKKLDNNSLGSIEKLLPFLGMFVDIDEKKLNTMMALGQLQGLQNGTLKPATGIAGLQEKKAEVQTTEEEKKIIEDINEEMGKLSEKVELESIKKFVHTLNEKPELLKTLINMAENFK